MLPPDIACESVVRLRASSTTDSYGDSVRSWDTPNTGEFTDWVLRPEGVLYRHVGWPAGLLSVTLTHGYAGVPADLLPVLAARSAAAGRLRDPAVSSVSVGQVQTAYFRNAAPVVADDPVLARYSVRVGVA